MKTIVAGRVGGERCAGCLRGREACLQGQLRC